MAIVDVEVDSFDALRHYKMMKSIAVRLMIETWYERNSIKYYVPSSDEDDDDKSEAPKNICDGAKPVSYTHLTLPTTPYV